MPAKGSLPANLCLYCLRDNETDWDEQTVGVSIYTLLTELEAVFLSLELDLSAVGADPAPGGIQKMIVREG